MGNRAVIVMESAQVDEKGKKSDYRGPAIYLQWNGGAESIHAFLKELDNRGMRVNDPTYETARLVHVIGDYFDTDGITTLSLGLWNLKSTSDKALTKISTQNIDNGVYLVNRAAKTVRRCVEGEWLTAAEAKAEKAKAVKNETYKDILNQLKADRKDKNIED